MSGLLSRILGVIERICRSAVPIALGCCGLILAMIALAWLTGRAEFHTARIVGIVPLLALIILMMARAFIHGMALNLAVLRRCLARLRP